jgi:hypothetical protein
MLGDLICRCSKFGPLFTVLGALTFIMDCQDKLRGGRACFRNDFAGIKLCRLRMESASGLGFSPLAAPVSMPVLGRMMPLAIGPRALVAIWMLVHIVGIERGKV